jgi:probable addiction module antidote protein
MTSKSKKPIPPKSVSYQDYLIESLKDPEEATGYLNAALEGGDIHVFLLALQNVIKAQGGITALAAKTKRSRTSLYKTLSPKGNPYLKNANELLCSMGMHLSIVRNDKAS